MTSIRRRPLVEEQAALFRMLGNPLRLALLLQVQESAGTLSLVEITGRLARQGYPVCPPGVSLNLSRMREMGFVRARKIGTAVYYSLCEESLRQMQEVLSQLLSPPLSQEGA